MEVAILAFEQMTALDAIGPYEVLCRLPGANVKLVGTHAGAVRCRPGDLTLLVEQRLDQCPAPEIVVVPGGHGQEQAMADESILGWLRAVHEGTRFTTSVCTGSLILAGAGLLEGRRATSHWLALDRLAEMGARPVRERVVRDGRIITAAGVSAGIDMALALAGEVAGVDEAQTIQLGIEYDPQPPYDSGSPDRAPAAVRQALSDRTRHRAGRAPA